MDGPTGGSTGGWANWWMDQRVDGPQVFAVGGSWLLPKAALRDADYAAVEALAREACRALRGGAK